MIKNAPTRDRGMAIVGMITERTDPKERKITRVTISNASARVITTSLMELLT